MLAMKILKAFQQAMITLQETIESISKNLTLFLTLSKYRRNNKKCVQQLQMSREVMLWAPVAMEFLQVTIL